MARSRPKITILIVDDHEVLRQGLRVFLEMHDDMQVIGEASNGAEAIKQTLDKLPDVILMDLVMPEMDGIEAMREILSLKPETKVIAFTTFGEDDRVFNAIRSGASGYLLKDVSPRDLVNAIRAVHRGEAPVHPQITKMLLDKLMSRSAEVARDKLTERELEVLCLISQGMSNRQIAQELMISEKTVKVHVSRVLSKLRVTDRTQAAIYALKEELF